MDRADDGELEREAWHEEFRELMQSLDPLDAEVMLSSLQHIDNLLVTHFRMANDDVIDMITMLKEIVK